MPEAVCEELAQLDVVEDVVLLPYVVVVAVFEPVLVVMLPDDVLELPLVQPPETEVVVPFP